MQPVAPTLAQYSGSQGQKQEIAEFAILYQNSLAAADGQAHQVHGIGQFATKFTRTKHQVGGFDCLPGQDRLNGTLPG